ncbi:uncharacterized protein [Rutidosis leptorrhynchoides]|uniref:uncharacterized protein n=1 Tax=Rutidosis leptorrhynchoides TaxID=125765 RepID=UPI003A9A53A2
MYQTLIYKWRWRLVNNSDACWAKIIDAIHGQSHGGNLIRAYNASGTWSNIVKCIALIHENNYFTADRLSLKVGNGFKASFWLDPWLSNITLATSYHRLFALETDRYCSVASSFTNGNWCWSWRRPPRGGVEASQLTDLCNALQPTSLSSMSDYWVWENPPFNEYTVSKARRLIENKISFSSQVSSMWCKTVPIKTNIFIWRLNIDRLPTISNLNQRDIFVERDCCPLCDVSEESRNHLFIRCDTSHQIWCKIGTWLDISIPLMDSVEDLWSWIHSIPHTGNKRFIVNVVAISTLWHIWKLRNGIIFKDHNTRKSYVFDYIVLSSFNWIYSRYHKSSLNWTTWLHSPLYSL